MVVSVPILSFSQFAFPFPRSLFHFCGMLCILFWLSLAMGGSMHLTSMGMGHQPLGQFSVLLALCHRVLLISTFFSHPPSEALPGSGAGDITNSKQ